MPDSSLLEKKLRFRLRDLDSMPFIFRKLLNILNKPYPSARELGLVIAADQSLSLKVLRMVNSAAAGVRNQVLSVPQAVSLLGINTVRSVTVCLASYESFFDAKEDHRRMLWRHSLGTALLARNLSRESGICSPEEMFVAGMLHDVGLSVLAKHCPREWASLQRAYPLEASPLEAERTVLGTDHAVIGGWACEYWKLPDVLNHCVVHHHSPLEAGEFVKPASLIHLADAFNLRSLSPGHPDLTLLVPQALRELDLPADRLTAIERDSLRELEDLESYINDKDDPDGARRPRVAS